MGSRKKLCKTAHFNCFHAVPGTSEGVILLKRQGLEDRILLYQGRVLLQSIGEGVILPENDGGLWATCGWAQEASISTPATILTTALCMVTG